MRLISRQQMDEDDRQALTAFLQGTQSTEYSPASGQITGILKTLEDEIAEQHFVLVPHLLSAHPSKYW